MNMVNFADRRAHRPWRGFSMVELVVSFVLFLIIAGALSLAVGRAATGSFEIAGRARAQAALGTVLDQIAAVPYGQLLNGTFDVPSPCEGTPHGITGQSCLKDGRSVTTIRYGFATDPAHPDCSSTDATRFGFTHGFVTLAGCVTSSTGGATSIQTRQVNAPHPGWQPGSGVVRAVATGQWAKLPAGLIALTHPATDGQPATLVATAAFGADGSADIPVTDGTCTATSRCVLALTADDSPDTVTGTDGHQVALSGLDVAGYGTGFALGDGAIRTSHVAVTATGTVTLAAVVAKGAVRVPNPTPGSVCVWVTFPSPAGTITAPECNTRADGKLALATYDPNWASYGALTGDALGAALAAPATGRIPLPTGVPIAVTMNGPDGTCPYAPGMLASQPGATSGVGGAPDNWAPLAVCASYTWGLPTHVALDAAQAGGTPQTLPYTDAGITVTLQPGVAQTGELVFDNVTLAPGAVGYGTDSPWAKPRTAGACSADQTCTSPDQQFGAGSPSATWPAGTCVGTGTCPAFLAAVSPEYRDCPGAYCYSAANAGPYLALPETGTAHLTQSGVNVLPITVTDLDDAGDTITARVKATPANTTATVGAATDVGAHTATFPVTFTDLTGNTQLKAATFTLTSGSGARQVARTVTIGLYYQPGVWQLSAEPVTVAQGGQDIPVTIRAIDTALTPLAGVAIDLSTDISGASGAGGTTGQDGTVAAFLSVPADTAPGTYTLTATATGTGRTVDIPITVTSAVKDITLTAPATLAQGEHGPLTVTAKDNSGTGMAGITVHLAAALAGSGTPSDNVWPEYVGCVTDDTGTCTVQLHADPAAPAGGYRVTATEPGGRNAEAATTVTSVAAVVLASNQQTLLAGTALAVPVRVLDGAGGPTPNVPVTIGGLPAGVSAGTASTDSAGNATVTLTADATTAAGTWTATLTSGAARTSMTVKSVAK